MIHGVFPLNWHFHQTIPHSEDLDTDVVKRCMLGLDAHLGERIPMLHDLIASSGQFTTLGIFLRLGVATLAGFIVGLEREAKNKSAGIKTHVLVCIGSALCLIVGQYVYLQFPGGADITRIGSSVVSGVGFLGVGTIMVTGNREVRGLTTAAGLWACACIGLAAGAGYIEGVLVTLAYVLFTLLVLRHFDQALLRLSKDFDLYVEIDENHNVKHFLHEKWITPVQSGIIATASEVVEMLIKQIEALSAKYAISYNDLNAELVTAQDELSCLISDLTGDEYAIRGLNVFKNSLK